MTQAANQPTAPADEWFTPGRFLALLALALFAAFPEVVLGSHTFYYRDFGHFAYPLAQYHRDCFWRGEIPLWNPYNSCGLPHLAQWNTMCLYPGALLYLLGPMPWALGLFSLAHLMLAGAGAYQLAHHWTGSRFAASVGGLAFALNGFTLHAVMWPNNVAALAWAPWLWLLAERACREGGRTLLLAALVGAMQMLAGAPEVILFTWAIAVPLALGGGIATFQFSIANLKLPLLRLTALALLVTLLSAAQLLPFLDLLQHSHRTAAFDQGHYALPLSGWANFFVPLFRMTPDRNGVFTHPDQQWTSSYYPGLAVLALAVLAIWQERKPRVRLLAAVAVLGVWLAMGKNALLLDWLKTICPPLGFIRFPVKYVLLPLMVLPFLAAVGAAERRSPNRREPSPSPIGSPSGQLEAEPAVAQNQLHTFSLLDLGIVLAAFGLIILGTYHDSGILKFFHGIHADELDSALGQPFSASRQLQALGLVALAWMFLRRATSVRASVAARLTFLVMLAIDILTHAPRQNPTVIPHAYEPGIAKFSTTMPRLGEGRALITREMEIFMAHASNPDALNYVLGARRALFANWNLLEGVPKANGFYSLFPHELTETWRLLYGFDHPFPERFADFLGITRASSSDALFTWSHRTSAHPLITAGQRGELADGAATLNALASTNWNPSEVVFLRASDFQSPSDAGESNGRRLQTAGTAAAKVVSSKWSAHRVECEVESSAPTLVVLAQAYYHPWQATVNGQPAEILRANHAFQAVPVPADRSTVRLQYVDRRFQLGVALSALGVVVCGVLWWRARPLPVGNDVRSFKLPQTPDAKPNPQSS